MKTTLTDRAVKAIKWKKIRTIKLDGKSYPTFCAIVGRSQYLVTPSAANDGHEKWTKFAGYSVDFVANRNKPPSGWNYRHVEAITRRGVVEEYWSTADKAKKVAQQDYNTLMRAFSFMLRAVQ
jgi:hypothetical protein